MEFIHDDFLLHSETARQLYHNYAAGEPVLDYHSHLSPADIATDRRFRDLSEMWLEGDHYKWRAMRANGIDERYCTGTAARYEKFLAWARTVPATLRNPLYHWTHLELKRYFGVGELLDERSAKNTWDKANALLATPELSVRNILRKFRVLALCTTDDPCDDLAHHQKIAADRPGFRVYPTFRPDQALQVYAPGKFNSWVERLAAASNRAILKFSDFLEALQERHDYFHANGGRISDHGLARCPAGSSVTCLFSPMRRP
jgi:glucuronate isomerase